MYRNGDAGVYVQDSAGNEVIDNIAHQESDGGVVLNGAPTTRSSAATTCASTPTASRRPTPTACVLEGNDGSDSLAGRLRHRQRPQHRGLNNVANRTGGTGISLEGGVFDADGYPIGPATIEGNTANENFDDGISVAAGGHACGPTRPQQCRLRHQLRRAERRRWHDAAARSSPISSTGPAATAAPNSASS